MPAASAAAHLARQVLLLQQASTVPAAVAMPVTRILPPCPAGSRVISCCSCLLEPASAAFRILQHNTPQHTTARQKKEKNCESHANVQCGAPADSRCCWLVARWVTGVPQAGPDQT